MKSLMSLYAMGFAAMMSSLDNPYYMGNYSENPMNYYQPAKMCGGTPCKGRKHLTKKERKQLKKK